MTLLNPNLESVVMRIPAPIGGLLFIAVSLAALMWANILTNYPLFHPMS
jgi:hypothetical protein